MSPAVLRFSKVPRRVREPSKRTARSRFGPSIRADRSHSDWHIAIRWSPARKGIWSA